MKLSIEIEAKNQAKKAFEELSKNIENVKKSLAAAIKANEQAVKQHRDLASAVKHATDVYIKHGATIGKLRAAKIGLRVVVGNVTKQFRETYQVLKGSVRAYMDSKKHADLLAKAHLGLGASYRKLTMEQKVAYSNFRKYAGQTGIALGSTIAASKSVSNYLSTHMVKSWNLVKVASLGVAKTLTGIVKNAFHEIKISAIVSGRQIKWYGDKLKWLATTAAWASRGALTYFLEKIKSIGMSLGTWWQKGFGKLPEMFRSFGRQIFYAGVQLGTFLMIIKGLLNPLIDFQKNMADVSTMLMSDVKRWTSIYSSEVMKMAMTTGLAMDDLSKSLYNILSASIAPERAAEVMKAAGVAAIAGSTDIATASKTMVDVINTYGQAAGGLRDIADQLFGAVVVGQFRFEDLAKTLGNVLTVSSMAEVPFKELLASIATITKAGLPVDETMTSLRNTLLNFFQTTEKSKEALADLNLELDLNWVRNNGITGLIKELNRATAGRVAEIFREKRALRGLLPLLDHQQMFLEFTEQIGRSMEGQGATYEAYMKKAITLQVAIDKLNQTFKVLLITFSQGLIPAINTFINFMQLLIQEFLGYDDATKKLIAKKILLGVIITGLMPPITILIGAFANLAKEAILLTYYGIAPLIKFITILTYKTLALLAAQFPLIAQFLAIVAAIGLVVGAIVYVVKHFGDLWSAVKRAWQSIKDLYTHLKLLISIKIQEWIINLIEVASKLPFWLKQIIDAIGYLAGRKISFFGEEAWVDARYKLKLLQAELENLKYNTGSFFGKLFDFLPGSDWIRKNIAKYSKFFDFITDTLEKAKLKGIEFPEFENWLMGLKRATDEAKEKAQDIETIYGHLGISVPAEINKILYKIKEWTATLFKNKEMTLAAYEAILSKLDDVKEYYGSLPEEVERLRYAMENNATYFRKTLSDSLINQLRDWDDWRSSVVDIVTDTMEEAKDSVSEIFFKGMQGEFGGTREMFEDIVRTFQKGMADIMAGQAMNWFANISSLKDKIGEWSKFGTDKLLTDLYGVKDISTQIRDVWSQIADNMAQAASNVGGLKESLSQVLAEKTGGEAGMPSLPDELNKIAGVDLGKLGVMLPGADVLKDMNLGESLSNVVNNKETKGGFIEGIKGFFGGAKDTIKGGGKGIFDGIVSAVGKGKEGLVGSLGNLTNVLKGGSGAGGGAAALSMGGQLIGSMVGGTAGGVISGAAQGAAMGSMIAPGPGTAIGAVAGGAMSAITGGGEHPNREYAKQMNKMTQDLIKEIQETGIYVPTKEFLEEVLPFSPTKADMKRFEDFAKTVSQEIEKAVSSGFEEGLKSPSLKAGVEELREKFSEGMIDALVNSLAKAVSETTIFTQLLSPFILAIDYIGVLFRKLFQEIPKYLGEAMWNVIAAITPVWQAVLGGFQQAFINPAVERFNEFWEQSIQPAMDVMELLFNELVKYIENLAPVVRAALIPVVAGVTGAILVIFSEIWLGLFQIFSALLEPIFQILWTFVHQLQVALGTFSDEIEDMVKSGFDLAKVESKRMLDFIQNAYKSLQSIIGDALKAGFEAGTKEAGWAVFYDEVRDNLYEYIVDAIVSSVTAFGIFMQAIGPHLDEMARLTFKAFRGAFNPDEWSKLMNQVTNDAVASLETLQPYFNDLWTGVNELYDILHGGDLPEEFYVFVETEPPDMTWWERMVLAIETIMAPFAAAADAFSGAIVLGVTGLLNWINVVVEAFINILTGLNAWIEFLWDVWTEIVVAIYSVWKKIWDKFFAPFFALLIYTWQQIFNIIVRPIIAGFHTVFKWVYDNIFAPIFAGFHMLFQKVWDGFINVVIGPLYELFGQKLLISFQTIYNDVLRPWLRGAWDVFVWFYNSFVGWWLKPLLDTFEQIYNQFVRPLLNGLTDIFNFFLGKIWELGKFLLPSWELFFPEKWEIKKLPAIQFTLPDFFTEELSDEWFNNLVPAMNLLIPTTEELTSHLKSLIEHYDSYEDALEAYRGKIMDTVDFMDIYFPEFTDTFEDVLESVKGWMPETDNVRQWMDALAPSLEGLISPLERLSSSIEGMVDWLQGRFPGIGWPEGFQTGGIIPRTGLYRMHAGEEVYSPYTTGQFALGSQGTTVNLTVNMTNNVAGDYDVQRIAEDIGFYIERRLNR